MRQSLLYSYAIKSKYKLDNPQPKNTIPVPMARIFYPDYSINIIKLAVFDGYNPRHKKIIYIKEDL